MLFEKKTGSYLVIWTLSEAAVELDFVDFDSTQTQDLGIDNACYTQRKVYQNDQCLITQPPKI